MFTGIVDHIAEVKKIERHPKFTLLVQTHFSDLILGESVSIDGVCLTVMKLEENGLFGCELSGETLHRSTASKYQVGQKVNVERALRFSDRLGGHLVSGHVDEVGICLEKQTLGEFTHLLIQISDAKYFRFLMEKGSVCVNGVSLTVNRVSQAGFEVMLIPHTLERTNLKLVEPNSKVNLEFDWLTKVILNEIDRTKGNLSCQI